MYLSIIKGVRRLCPLSKMYILVLNLISLGVFIRESMLTLSSHFRALNNYCKFAANKDV